MYKWSIRCVIKKTVSLSYPISSGVVKQTGLSGRGIFWGALLLTPLLLTGCTDNRAANRFSQAVQLVIPETKSLIIGHYPATYCGGWMTKRH